VSLLPNCAEVAKLLSEARDSGRPLGSHARLHLWVCEVCRRLQKQFEVFCRASAACHEKGPCLPDDVKARLKKKLE
jgi:hypothetical protein